MPYSTGIFSVKPGIYAPAGIQFLPKWLWMHIKSCEILLYPSVPFCTIITPRVSEILFLTRFSYLF
ncbi:hypothetical protein BEI60_26780 [Eisenbergiella tayi]|nr:hypothetical protein BEI60_26780 [Eisenbergiella tayi]ODR41992.1 hypothetical protein BEI62_07720 [Eisenbergiella tayi]